MAGKSLDVIKRQPLMQCESVKEMLNNDQARGRLAEVAAKHLNPERMMRLVSNAIRTTPKLAECEPMSLLGALMTCASLGLEPNTVLGHAYLIPFKNNRKGVVEVQLVIGYKGFIDLARRSGRIVSMHADVVYSDDEYWSYEYGTDAHLRHKPGPRQGEPTHAYCHVKLVDGQAFVVLPWAEVIATRDRSQGWQTAVRFNKTAESPWTLHLPRMAAKTAVRRMANSGEIPLSIEMQRGLEVDETRADYGGFALDPGNVGGPTIDADPITPEGGDAFDPETGEIVDETPAETPDERPHARPAAEKPKGKPKPAPKPATEKAPPDDAIPDEIASLMDRIANDLADAGGNEAMIADVLDMFGAEIEVINGTSDAAAARMAEIIAEAKAGEA